MNCNDLKSKKYIRDLKQPRVAKSKPTCPVLFNTANRFLATKMALCPLPLNNRFFHFKVGACWQRTQLIKPVIRGDGQNDSSLGWVEAESPWRHIGTAKFARIEQADV